ncbi:hypothetical protein [Ectobacillus sp. JY-23]|uniref:hypothetical protein n=1 Tax=Ectobacillus sp. JY-23 TaxID=2933872 RepID=UPI0034A08803
MWENQELVLVCVGDEEKVACLHSLIGHRTLIIVTVHEMIAWTARELGFQCIIRSTQNPQALLPIAESVSKAIVLSDTLPTISFFTELIRFNLNVPITVVTRNKQYPVQLYKTMGAKYVVYTNCDNMKPFVS